MERSLKILILFFLFFKVSVAQNNASISNTFVQENNFLHKEYLEKFAIHTNKSVYFSGEDIWFKTYVVYDVTETPNYTTTNLHINIYDAEKNLIVNQLALLENGKVEGYIKIPEDTKTNTYYIQLDTNWNSNFENAYIKPIKINNLKDGFVNPEENISFKNDSISFQFFPESNVILENTQNTIYFTVSENYLPIKLKGNIIDANDEIISEFNSDENGQGSFKLNPYSEGKFFVVANNLKYEIPKAQKIGFIIHKKENKETNDVISLSLTTNKATILQEKENTFFAVIHRKGYVLSAIPVTLDEAYYSYKLKLLKKDLFNGINTITLFNSNNQPIAERNIYSTNKKLIELEAVKVSSKKDSTTIKLNLKNIFNATNVSVSVLPENSLMYQNKYNIVTDFLVTPYLNNKTGNVTTLFTKKANANKLDTYIQTKSKNNFKKLPNNSIKNNKAEVGTKISGSVILNKAGINNSKIMLTSQENNIVLVSKLKPNNTFVFDSLLLKQNSIYKLSLIDNNGKLLKATIHVNEELISYKPELALNNDLKDSYIKGFLNNETENQSSKQIKKQEYLDEVIVKGKTKKIVLPDDYPDPKVRGNSVTKTYIIDENRYLPSQTAMDVIKDLPGTIVDVYSTSVRSTRGQKSIIESVSNAGSDLININSSTRRKGTAEDMSIILNGVRVTDFSYLKNISATDIIEAKVNASGAGYGLDGFAGVIILKTKRNINPFKNKIPNTESTLKVGNVDFGFTIPVKNYSNYDLQFPSKNSRIYYKTLDWIPNLELKPNTDNFITVYNDNLDKIKLIINGQNDKGNLIYKDVTIINKDNQ